METRNPSASLFHRLAHLGVGALQRDCEPRLVASIENSIPLKREFRLQEFAVLHNHVAIA
jgi:hypothetical protein